MTLHMIGLGLGNEKDISINALEVIKKCSYVYLEYYTSLLSCPVEVLEDFYGKKIIIADRTLVESKADSTILKEAQAEDVAFLVAGDIFGATTHADLVLRARAMDISLKFYHNASIMSAIGVTGLELYKFGKTTSMPFFDKSWKPGTAYEVIAENQKNGLHTLILLDIKVAEPSSEALLKGDMTPAPARFMTAGKCLKQLRELEGIHKKGIITDKTYCVCCARVGQPDMVIKYGLIKDLVSYDLGKPLHCIIIPGSLHFVEEEMLRGFL